MTLSEDAVRKMESGLEMDCLIYEMIYNVHPSKSLGASIFGDHIETHMSDGCFARRWSPSSEPWACAQLRRKLIADGYHIDTKHNTTYRARVGFVAVVLSGKAKDESFGDLIREYSDPIAAECLCLCRAALLAKIAEGK